MLSDSDNNRQLEKSGLMRNRFLSFIRIEAEYILNAWNTTKYTRPSWDPYVPTKYDLPDEACLRISNIWKYIIISFFTILVLGGCSSTVFWLPMAHYTLFIAEYYIGISVTLSFTILNLSTHKLLRRFLLRISSSRSSGERRFIYIEVGIEIAIGTILLVLQLVWKLPFGMFVLYFILFNAIYTFLIMSIYLIMRLKLETTK
jgi:hypothetical protein